MSLRNIKERVQNNIKNEIFIDASISKEFVSNILTWAEMTERLIEECDVSESALSSFYTEVNFILSVVLKEDDLNE